MSKNNSEIVYEGWLIKSPPTKRIWRARWRRRWFTLCHSGELPGQFFLEYYTDRNYRKLKGTIDLDQCEQVDAGLHFEQRKLKYPYMFDVKTPSRVYYLAAESEQDMNKWVDYICQVCQLKAYSSDDQELDESVSGMDLHQIEPRIVSTVPETPPLSPISGPYIPISECISGPPLTPSIVQDYDVTPCIPPTPQKRKYQQHSISSSDICTDSDPRFYDMPRQLQLPTKITGKCYDSNLNSSLERASTPPLQSPTDSESVFTDDECVHPVLPLENGIREPRPSDSSIEPEPSSWSVVQRFGKLTVVDSPSIKTSDSICTTADEAPPRPPKPSHLGQKSKSLTLGNMPNTSRIRNKVKENVDININPPNADDMVQAINDEMYDFPRSHVVTDTEISKSILPSRHCYNNAAPSSVDGNIFRYDITTTEDVALASDSTHDEEPASPCSQSSSSTAAFYSNLPSPSIPEIQSGSAPPPVVNRGLKPGRKLSDSASVSSLAEPPSPRLAPNVDRKLKPNVQTQVRKPNELDVDQSTLRPQRAAPSPTPSSLAPLCFIGDQVYLYNNVDSRSSKDFDKLQYLDLDLDSESYNNTLTVSHPPKSPGPLTVYKTVDFVKTEAFKRTRQDVEDARKKCSVEP